MFLHNTAISPLVATKTRTQHLETTPGVTVPESHPQPSQRARDLVRGAYDIHVHIDPDIIPRRITDLALAKRFNEVELEGFVLKSHYVPTTERASVVNAASGSSACAIGSITLNHGVGGMNACAVEIAARGGARIVWMPTVDAANEARELEGHVLGTKLPLWAVIQTEMRAQGLGLEPVRVVNESGEILPETLQVLRVIARHDLVLATGHLGRDEIFAVVDAALEEGVKHIVITHPDYPTQDLSIQDQIVLAERGAYLERCVAPSISGKVSWEKMFTAIRATGPEHSVLSTDMGQPKNPPVEDGLPIIADLLLEAGFSDDEVRVMTVTNSRRLVGVQP
jgi:Family of unknown function (DUF6282)